MYRHSNSKTLCTSAACYEHWNHGANFLIQGTGYCSGSYQKYFSRPLPTWNAHYHPPASPSPFYISSLQIMLEYSFLHEFSHDNLSFLSHSKSWGVSSLNSAFSQLLDIDSWCYRAVSCVFTQFLKLSSDNLS